MKTRLLLVALVAAVPTLAAEKTVLRVGFFPNITHAQGVIGRQTAREGRGWFEQRLGPGVEIQWFAFNAGPSAMEAIFAGALDLTYVGPNPALNAYIRSQGDEIRVLAGAAEGGAALVVAGDGRIKTPADFRGRKLATPQFGNTQDVAARAWLKQQGFKVSQTGGDVWVLPTANPDQLALLASGRIDAVWTVEPWVSRLEQEAGGRVFLEQPDVVTTLLVSSVRLLRERPELARQFRAAHVELTQWLNAHESEAREIVRAGLSAEVRREFSAGLVASAWRRLRFTAELTPAQLEGVVTDARSVGFLPDALPLDRLFSLKP
ncbi:MAG TPA: ABC transporter substrate-binding protein [Opitutaceae bacterium]|nr:ABC transporter substrate-binding protein [Opitutaceae bacterium]